MTKTIQPAFPKIFHIGTDYIADLFKGPVEVTEKLDGSQFGFGKIDGELRFRSKGKEQTENPDNMFMPGVEYLQEIEDKLPDGLFFYAEYLQKPKHSTLAYNRIPKNHFALFGVAGEGGSMLPYSEIKVWAERLEIEAIPLLFEGEIKADSELDKLLKRESFLGGQDAEGIVVKRYAPWLFQNIPFPLMAGKFVTEKFKETHKKNWNYDNTAKGGVEKVKASLRTEARWDKAVSHLRDDGKLTNSPKDIGPLLAEVWRDIKEEEGDYIKSCLFKTFENDIKRYVTSGMPEWYKEKLRKQAFKEDENDATTPS